MRRVPSINEALMRRLSLRIDFRATFRPWRSQLVHYDLIDQHVALVSASKLSKRAEV